MKRQNEIDEIKESVQKLASRCDELNVNLVASFSSEESDFAGVAIVGSPMEAFILLQQLKDALLQQMKMANKGLVNDLIKKQEACDCPNCSAKRAAQKEYDGESVSFEEITKIIKAVLGGSKE